jgi:hypothetical protein
MEEKNSLVKELSIEEVSIELEQWRETKKARERIPEPLWEAAVKLTSHYSINQVSERLRLNYRDLKKRIHSSGQQGLNSSKFIELDTAEMFCTGECIVEMQRRDGSTMKISFQGGTCCDLVELGKVFWSEG